MKYPTQLKYSKEHEWLMAEGTVATVGITDHAQSALGDIVYLELPKVGRVLKKGETFGVVESIKAVSDLYSPVDGKVVEIHSALIDQPGQINSSPYEPSWMIKIEMSEPSQANELLNSTAYETYVASL